MSDTALLKTYCDGEVPRPPARVSSSGHQPTAALELGRRTLYTVADVCPGVRLIASVDQRKNQCVIELVRSVTKPSPSASLPTTDDGGASSPASAPLLGALGSFRVPKIIQVLAEDEGEITTIELVAEGGRGAPLKKPRRSSGTGVSPAASAPDRASRNNQPGQPSESAPDPADTVADSVFVHLFIGTSNGTVIVCNALRGTILAMAQFQYRHNFSALMSTEEQSTAPPDGSVDSPEREARSSSVPSWLPSSARSAAASLSRRGRGANEAVVRFAVQERDLAVHRNNPTITIPPRGSQASSFATGGVSPTGSSGHISGVYVIHDGGTVVFLGRNVLDEFISVVVSRQDGQRPCFVLEWSPTSTHSSYPVAGPASSFAPLVQFVHVLIPPDTFSANEMRTIAQDDQGKPLPPPRINDAAFVFTSKSANASIDDVLTSGAVDSVQHGIIVCGSTPAYALYSLEERKEAFSARNAVKAVTSLVANVAKSWWFGGSAEKEGRNGGAVTSAAPPPRLEKRNQRSHFTLLEGDSVASSISVDPTHQFAALYAEGTRTTAAGRILLVDLRSGVLWRTMKGCRDASFCWWIADVAGRPTLLLVVYLPQRSVVEVHAIRTRQRLAAGYVPAGSVLLRTSTYGCAKPTTTRAPSLLTPDGEIIVVSLSDFAPSVWVTRDPLPHSSLSTKSQPQLAGTKHSGVVSELLQNCHSPDDFFDAAMQLPLPQWDFTAATDVSTATDDGSKPVDKFQVYRRQLKAICSAVRRRYALQIAELQTVAPPTPNEAELTALSPAVPRGLSASQCLTLLQQRRELVKLYADLAHAATSTQVRSHALVAADVPLADGSPLLPPTLTAASFQAPSETALSFSKNVTEEMTSVAMHDSYHHSLACDHAHGKTYWDSVVRKICVMLDKHRPTDAAMLKKNSASWRPVAVAKQLAAAGVGKTAEKVCIAAVNGTGQKSSMGGGLASSGAAYSVSGLSSGLMETHTFLSLFSCALDNQLQYHREQVKALEDDADMDVTRDLALLFFGKQLFHVFVRRLETASGLGLSVSDVAEMTLAWIAVECTEDLGGFLANTTLGQLHFHLNLFPTSVFLSALRRVRLPLYDLSTGAYTPQELGSCVYGLLMCCAVRMVYGERLESDSDHDAMSTTICQLLRLWSAAAPHTLQCVAPESVIEAAEASLLPQRRAIERAAGAKTVGVRLSYLHPITLDQGDALESHLLRSGVPRSDLLGASSGKKQHTDTARTDMSEAFLKCTLARPDCPPVAREFPFPQLVQILMEVGTETRIGARRPSSCFAVTPPWLRSRVWSSATFEEQVLRPLTGLCHRALPVLDSRDEGNHALTVLLEGKVVQNWKSLQQCCLMLACATCTQEVVRPLMEAEFSFWHNNGVPDVNFFCDLVTSAGVAAPTTTTTTTTTTGAGSGAVGVRSPATPGQNWLDGSRSHQNYLESAIGIATLTCRTVEAVLGSADEMKCVLLIQSIVASVAEDDGSVFPVVPRCLRSRLKLLIQLLGHQPDALQKRIECVCRFLSLLRFFLDTGELSVDGNAIDVSGLGSLKIPWAALCGASLSTSFQLLPTDEPSSPAPRSSTAGTRASRAEAAPGRAHHPALAPVYDVTDDLSRLHASLTLAKAFLDKCVVPGVTSAVLASPADGVPDNLLRLIVHPDTTAVLAKLCGTLGLLREVPGLAPLLIFDYQLKLLCRSDDVRRALLQAAERGMAARVGVRILRTLVAGCMTYCTVRKRYHMERQDKAQFDVAANRMQSIVLALSSRCKQWLKVQGTNDPKGPRVSVTAGGPVSGGVRALVGGAGWISPSEQDAVVHTVVKRLSLPSSHPLRSDFFELLFLLAQLANEQKCDLDEPDREVVTDLPALSEILRKHL